MVATILERPLDLKTTIDLDPKSTYEVITREKVEHIADELKEIRFRVNGIFWVVIGSVLMDMAKTWLP